MENILFISNSDQIKRLKKYCKTIPKLNIILLSNTLNKLDYPKIRYYDEITNDFKKWGECIHEAKEYFDLTNKIKISNKDVFDDILGYKKVSLLDLDSVHYLSAHTEILANIFFKTSVIFAILKKVKPSKVFIINPKTDWEKIIKAICKNRSIEIADQKPIKCLFKAKHFLTVPSFQKNLSIPASFIPLLILSWKYMQLIKKYVRAVKTANLKNRFESKKTILFYVINNKYVDIIMPLVKSIKKDGDFYPFVIVPPNFDAERLFKINNIPFAYFNDYITNTLLRESIQNYFSIIKKFNKLVKNDQFKQNVFKYNETNLEDVLLPHFKNTFLFSINSILNMLVMENIIKKINAQLLFISHYAENNVKSFIMAAKQQGIPSMNLFRGTTGNTSEYGTANADKIIVAGKHSYNDFIGWGIDKKKICTTGLPIFDSLINKLTDKIKIEKDTRKALNISEKFHIMTYLTQSYSGIFRSEQRLEEIKLVFETVKKIKDIFLIIKLHPTEENIGIYEKTAVEMNLQNYIIIKNDLPLDDLLISSEIALTKNSTSGFNALISGCRLIVLGFTESTLDTNFFVEGKVAFIAKDKKSLAELINGCIVNNVEISNVTINNFLNYHFNTSNGNSIELIKKEIYDTIKL